jgi:O-antigen ligase
VGLGGAGFALYNNGLSPAPKEIVQNEYASLLLETGLVGASLFVLSLVLVIGVIWKNFARVVLIGLLAAYGVSLMFFSGLPNGLHIVLFPMIIEVFTRSQN